MSTYILSHDIGTTGDKAALFSDEGTLVSSSFCSYPTYYPEVGWAEQDPEDYWKAFCQSTKRLLADTKIKPEEIGVISFSGQMMAALPVDEKGRALRNSIIWADLRSTQQADALAKSIDRDMVYSATGHRLSASYSATKIMWIRENERDVYNNTYKFIHAKDYLVTQLTKKILTDYSDASGMNLLDINSLKWSEDLIDATGIEKEKLPDLVESTEVVGMVMRDAAQQCGVVEGTPVVIGGGDGACATCGSGVVSEGSSYIYLGTSTWMAIASDRPLIDPIKRTFTFCHFKRGLYFPAGTMQAGGGSYQWFKNTLCEPESAEADKEGIDVYDILNKKAEATPAGSGGIIFLPYLMGERSPLWNPDARGCFIGLSMIHDKGYMIRAVLEGVAYNMKLIADAFAEQGVDTDAVRMIGGGAKSRLWRMIFADVMEKPVLKLNFIEEATSVGAAIAGGVGVGIFSSINDSEKLVHVTEETKPQTENIEVYKRNHRIFKDSIERLNDIFVMLSDQKN
ncbi:MAG: xylulokinase [Spirochaetota bacterium]|nr:MAG: xylulokinase [Spirochaetota bacterium]